MATRATRLAPSHVQALNRIDIEFGKTKWRRQSPPARQVTNRWRIYADHLHDLADDPTPVQLEAWVRRGDDLFINLLASLATALDYSFDEVQLRRGIYHPRGHTDAEIRQDVIQRALADILVGNRSFPMEVTGSNERRGSQSSEGCVSSGRRCNQRRRIASEVARLTSCLSCLVSPHTIRCQNGSPQRPGEFRPNAPK